MNTNNKKVLTLRVSEEMDRIYRACAKADGFNTVAAWIQAAIAVRLREASYQTTINSAAKQEEPECGKPL